MIFELRRVARLGLREDVPVAIVVVPNILMIKLRRRRAVVRRASRLAVPLGDDVDAVRVLRRLKQEDDVVENGLKLRVVVFGQQPISELDGGVRGGDFGRVDGAGNHHNHLAFVHEAAVLRQAWYGAGRPDAFECRDNDQDS